MEFAKEPVEFAFSFHHDCFLSTRHRYEDRIRVRGRDDLHSPISVDSTRNLTQPLEQTRARNQQKERRERWKFVNCFLMHAGLSWLPTPTKCTSLHQDEIPRTSATPVLSNEEPAQTFTKVAILDTAMTRQPNLHAAIRKPTTTKQSQHLFK